MIQRLTSELEQCVAQSPDGAVRVEGADGATYWIMSDEAMQIRRHVQVGLDAADRGEVSEWNTDELLAKAQQKLDERSA
ncbi:MAG: hypothetical protein ABGZ35_05390 [Planctomycetaceae bacterium]|jgi:hypothetical protein